MVTVFNNELDWKSIFSTAKRWQTSNSIVLNLDLAEQLIGTDISATTTFTQPDHFRKRALTSTSQTILHEQTDHLRNFTTLLSLLSAKGIKGKIRFIFQREKMITSTKRNSNNIIVESFIIRYWRIFMRHLKLVWILLYDNKQIHEYLRTQSWLGK